MECPTCGSDMVLMRTVTQDEVIELDKYGADVDMSIETHTLRAENERFICTANENDHTFPAEWDDDAEVYKFEEAKNGN